MFFLCADTSGSSICFSLAYGDYNTRQLVATHELFTGGKSSELFFPELDRFLSGVVLPDGKTIRAGDIDVWTAVTGPGSFTGIRICLAALTAVTLALGKTLNGLSALDAAALMSGMEQVRVAARLRLKEYAVRGFDFNEGHASIVTDVLDGSEEGIVFINSGTLSHAGYSNLTLAVADARCATYFTEAAPLYVKKSEAEINFDKKCIDK